MIRTYRFLIMLDDRKRQRRKEYFDFEGLFEDEVNKVFENHKKIKVVSIVDVFEDRSENDNSDDFNAVYYRYLIRTVCFSY